MVMAEWWSALVRATQIVGLFMTVMFLNSYLTLAEATPQQNFVKPIKGMPHITDHYIHTLEDYTSQQDQYFVNDTIFYFYPGIHTLDRSLDLKNVHNLTIHGLPGSEPVILVLGSSVSITWKNCWCIKISSVDFYLAGNFTHNIVFELTQSIQLSNISIFGNGSRGCSSILNQGSTLHITDSRFIGIKGIIGSALMISGSSTVTFDGNNRFESNEAYTGGAIYLHNSILTFNGNSLLMKNKAGRQNASIINNTLCNPSLNEIVYHTGFSQFSGGAILSNNSILIINNNSSFIENVAQWSGGSISAIYGNMTIRGFVLFDRNHAEFSGGAINLKYTTSEISANGSISLRNNSASFGGAMYVVNANVFFGIEKASINLQISQNACHSKTDLQYYDIFIFFFNIVSSFGGAIRSLDSNFTVSGTLCFVSNVASSGGAIAFDSTSKLILAHVLHISFILNHASHSGGALYIDSNNYDCSESVASSSPSDCFFSIGRIYSSTVNISLSFVNNSADTGSTLFGGELNKCRLCYEISTNLGYIETCGCKYHSDNALETFMNFSSIFLHKNSLDNISSPAQTLKRCHSNSHDKYNENIAIYPGEEFTITLKALGQTNLAVNATILIWEPLNFRHNRFSLSPRYQEIGNSRTNATYRLYSESTNINDNESFYVYLYLDNPCHNFPYDHRLKISLPLYIPPCPLGFALSEKDKICTCEPKLSKFVQNCYIDSLSIERTLNNFWVSKESESTVILHEFRCPVDYCKADPINVTLDKSNVQCGFNRTGSLCGHCQKNYSLVLGSLHCLPCSNHYISLILPFALVGILLVAIIFLLRLTVATGTLNGLLFFANIIQANNQAFFPRNTINFFTVFVSWLNLDLGIETCFYEGMDIYAYSWLQFLFPFYIWCLIACIILLSHYSQCFARSLGQNPVAVLATLLLMSFSKILTAIITPLSWTYLTYYNSTNVSRRIVWLYDGSMDFFKEPRHNFLGLFAIFTLVFVVLPYIVLLLCIHWLQGLSNRRALSWLNKLKPLMDAYHAPYERYTRYRTGLLLLTRLGLFLTFAINAFGSENINVLAVSSVTIVLLGMQVGRVYKHWWNDMLECSFLINLGIFSVATFYLKEEVKRKESDQSQFILSSISVGVAFATFIGILLFHTYFVIKSTSFWKVHMLPHIHKNQLLTRMLKTTLEKENNATILQESIEIHAVPTSTTVDVDLRESLIDAASH